MQAGNADVVREIIDALNAGSVDGMLERMDPDFEWKPLQDSPVPGPHRGHGNVRGYLEDWLATFPALRLDVEELTEEGDHVVTVVRGRARARASGVQLGNRFCQVWTLRGGTAVRMHEYATREEGLATLR